MLFRSLAPEVGEGPLTDSSMASWNVQLTTRFRTSSVNLVMLAVYYGRDFLYAHTSMVEPKPGKKSFCSLSIFYHVIGMTDDFFAIEWCLSWTARGLPSSSLPQEDGLKLLQMSQNIQTYFTFLVFLLSLLSYFEKIAHVSVLCAYVSLYVRMFVARASKVEGTMS